MTWTHRQRMLITLRGGMPDRIPFAPRLDLWFAANQKRGTLPPGLRDCRHWDEVSRRRGWGIAKVILEYQSHGDEALLDRSLGIYRIPSQGFLTHLPKNVERRVKREGDRIQLEYLTPKGSVRAAFVYTEDMRRSGISLPWISEHALKGRQDYPALAYIFANLEVEPLSGAYADWAKQLGEDGFAVVYALTAGSPMHHIMKILMDSTEFYYHYRDDRKEMEGLVESIGVYFRKVFQAVAGGQGEIILVGANFDDTITYPPFFRDHILPWLQEAANLFHAKGKLLLCHTDGENKGLMDYLWESGMDVADSVCPAPMTKVSLAEYYTRWSQRITLLGGVPSNLLLAEATTNEEFENFLDQMFKAVAPGNRFILGVADTVPPDAVFDRLLRIAERLEKEGHVPLAAGTQTPIFRAEVPQAVSVMEKGSGGDLRFKTIQEDLYQGLAEEIQGHVQQRIDEKIAPLDILNQGLLPAMEKIGQEFKSGNLFVPEVLLAARAMNAGLAVLEPHLVSAGRYARGRILIGTVNGDLHDIGKNMVIIMLRGVGFEVTDLGTNVSAADFVKRAADLKPDILGMSSLLTTTMSQMKVVIEGLSKADLRGNVKIMVGGAPVSRTFARQIGADGYAADAGEAVEVAKELLGVQ